MRWDEILEAKKRRRGPATAEWYLDGGCLTFAFAVHWMTDWMVEGVAAGEGKSFEHFAAIGPDGRVWDAAGPREKVEAGQAYADDPQWSKINVMKFISTAGVDEAEITEACEAAMSLLSPGIDPHIKRRPS